MKIYVSTYKKYNNGNLAGAWLDLEDYLDEEDFYAACRELHADEQDPELMFQDTEDIPEGIVTESSIDWEQLIDFGEVAKEYGESVAWTLVENNVPLDSEIILIPRELYTTKHEAIGYYYAEQLDIPSNIEPYFDYEKYGRDIDIEGYFIEMESDRDIIEVLS